MVTQIAEMAVDVTWKFMSEVCDVEYRRVNPGRNLVFNYCGGCVEFNVDADSFVNYAISDTDQVRRAMLGASIEAILMSDNELHYNDLTDYAANYDL